MDDGTYGRRDLSSVMPNNMNEEAVVFRGLTSTEIIFVSVTALLFWVVFGLIVGGMIGKTTLMLGFTFLATMITVVIAGTIMQKIKRNKPPGYYMHLILLFLGKYKLKRSPFIQYDGVFSIGRSRQVVLVSKHLKIDPDGLEHNAYE